MTIFFVDDKDGDVDDDEDDDDDGDGGGGGGGSRELFYQFLFHVSLNT